MRYRAFALGVSLILSAIASAAHAAPPEVKPILLAELDFRLHAAERIEGEDGFGATRLRLGAASDLAPWCSVLGQAEWAREKPVLLDAYVVLRPSPEWEIRLGAAKTPLFFSARDMPVFTLPLPERSMVARAFWPGRDVGIEVHKLATPRLPLEAWLRVGNGSGSVLGNDNSDFAIDARLDVALGRAQPRAPEAEPFGLRLGAGIHAESAEDRAGITGTTADAFTFYRPAIVSGPRHVVEAHAAVFAGPVMVTAEAALATEGRSKDTDGKPATPRVEQAAVASRGGSVEVAWMIRGPYRIPGAWPIRKPYAAWDWGALEVAGRFERLDLGRGAADVASGGATGGAAAVRWWATSFLGASAAWYYVSYDEPPVEEPDRSHSWLGLVRVTVRTP